MEQTNPKWKMPCVDCITFPICRAIYLDTIKTEGETFEFAGSINKPVKLKHIKKLVLARRLLCKRCSILNAHAEYIDKYGINFNDFHNYFHPKFNKKDHE